MKQITAVHSSNGKEVQVSARRIHYFCLLNLVMEILITERAFMTFFFLPQERLRVRLFLRCLVKKNIFYNIYSGGEVSDLVLGCVGHWFDKNIS